MSGRSRTVFNLIKKMILCTGLQENIFSWTSPGPEAFENGQALIFFRQAPPKKFHFTKSPHIKVLLVNKLRLGESVII